MFVNQTLQFNSKYFTRSTITQIFLVQSNAVSIWAYLTKVGDIYLLLNCRWLSYLMGGNVKNILCGMDPFVLSLNEVDDLMKRTNARV